jgi:CheY-like chemotaxis protein
MPVMSGFETIREIREQLYKAMAEAARSGSIASATCAGKPGA